MQLPQYMSKREALEYLGKSSMRTLENYVKDGKLPAEYVEGATGKVLRFRREDLELLKAGAAQPWVRNTATAAPAAPVIAPTAVATVARSEPDGRLKELKEYAATILGFPSTFLGETMANLATAATLARPSDIVAAAVASTGDSMSPREFIAGLAAAVRESPAAQPKPWLTLAEASEYSGLPKSFLVARAKGAGDGVLNVGIKRPSYRFNRDALGKA